MPRLICVHVSDEWLLWVFESNSIGKSTSDRSGLFRGAMIAAFESVK